MSYENLKLIVLHFALDGLVDSPHCRLDAFEHTALVASVGVEGVQREGKAFKSFALAHFGFHPILKVAMRVALHTTLAASKKEPLAELVGRIRQAFLDAGLSEPTIRFTLRDSPVPTTVSSIDRVLKRHPGMERFVAFRSLMPGGPETRMLSNYATGETVEYSTLQPSRPACRVPTHLKA